MGPAMEAADGDAPVVVSDTNLVWRSFGGGELWSLIPIWYGEALEVEYAREKQTKEQIEKTNRRDSEMLDVDCPCRRRQGAPQRPRNRPSPGSYSFDKNHLY